MGIFGWSLPPGCGTLPGEEPYDDSDPDPDEDTMTKPYTVLLLRPDYMTDNYGQDTFQTWVLAPDVAAAIRAAQEGANAADAAGVEELGSPEDYFALAVYEGHHYNHAGI